jgi:hypothetical protein
MTTNATAAQTTTSTVDGYTSFSICSRWRLAREPGFMCVGTAAHQAHVVAVVDELRSGLVLTNVRVGGGAGSAPARSCPRFITNFVQSC